MINPAFLLSLLFLASPLVSWHVRDLYHLIPLGTASETEEQVEPTPVYEPRKPGTLEVKAGYFFFADATMRKVYGQGGLDVQISGTTPVGWSWKWLQIYGSVEYLRREGRSLNFNQKTTLWEVPLSLGLQSVFEICPQVHWYATFGPRYIFLHMSNNSPFVDRSVSDNGLGLFVNTGFHFFPCQHLLIDLFGEYSYKTMKVSLSKKNVYSSSRQVGGFVFGGGLGYAF